jgi:hypothetical protein
MLAMGRSRPPAPRLRNLKRADAPPFYIAAMTLLLIDLLVLAAVTAATLFVYAQVLQAQRADEGVSAVGVDYAALHAQWQGERQASDWDSLQAQVRRWRELAAPGATRAPAEQVAHALNDAVFRFAVPGERPSFQESATAREPRRCPATRRVRAAG